MSGEAKIKALPLRPVGAKYDTKDNGVARELATNLLRQALFSAQKAGSWECDGSVMSIVKAFCDYARNYYKDVDGNITTEARRIEYATKPLVELYARLAAEEFGPLKLKQVRQNLRGNGTVTRRTGSSMSVTTAGHTARRSNIQ